jgi:hypothetical protein
MLRSHGRPAKMDTYCWAKRTNQPPKRKSTGGALGTAARNVVDTERTDNHSLSRGVQLRLANSREIHSLRAVLS